MSGAPLTVAFDHAEALPTGHRTVEASAGTGKTYALIGLATRFLAEGRCTADGLLVVTFSRSATAELRSRLLDRLTGSAALLGAMAAGHTVPPPHGDPVQSALVDGTEAEVAARAQRLRTALADIDHATITTIHGLCDDLLRRLGDERLGALLEDDAGLATEITSDLMLRIARHDESLVGLLPFAQRARAVVMAGMRTPPEAIEPGRTLEHRSGLRAYMAYAAGIEATARKARSGQHTHDDILLMLRDRISGSPAADVVAASIRRRLQVGLVDEFQDTDPVQWDVLRALFDDPTGGDGRTLVVVGDPKQAIYAFRGADIGTYLAARGDRADRTLVENRRADGPVVDAVTTLFQGMDLGPRISVAPVTPTCPVRLDPPPSAPVELRIVTDGAPVARGRGGARVGSMRDLVAADTAAHAVRILRAGGQVRSGDGPSDHRALCASDLTVLVRTGAQASLVQRHLVARGVPTVLNRVGNVLASPAAHDWLSLLRALALPSDARRARLAALTDLLGWSIADVVRADERRVESLHVLLHGLHGVFAARGVAALVRALETEARLSERLQGEGGGPRRLTDLVHLGEVLHAEARRSGLGPAGLVSWLEREVADAADPPPAHLARRLEQSGDAVEIMTVHGAKGLERGIVLVPFLWDVGGSRDEICTYLDPVDGRRRVDVGGDFTQGVPPDVVRAHAEHKAIAAQQQEQEEMRLAYVALTRARHHVVAWWGTAGQATSSPMSALLARDGITRSAAEAMSGALALQDAHPDLFTVVPVDAAPDVTAWRPEAREVPDLGLSVFARTVDRGWARHSYSAMITRGDVERIARGDLGPPVSPDPDDPASVHEPSTPEPSPADADGPLAAPVPLSAMAGGAEVGTVIHAVLERVDFTDPDLASALRTQLEVQSRAASVDLADDVVVSGLVAAIETPLGPAVGGIALRDIPRHDRIDELEFELPVLHGTDADVPGRLVLGDLADLLDEHLPPGDPMHGYGRVLRAGHADVELRGYLAGFVDLLVRVPGPDGAERYLVADYKTNRLGPPGAVDLLLGSHTTPHMAAAMWEHHYPVQAICYLVAAHRYLRWRLPGYDPGTHLVGAAYLFLRGMAGADSPAQPDGAPHGVLLWTPPPALLLATDALFRDGPGRRR